jgi:hypothetical protein
MSLALSQTVSASEASPRGRVKNIFKGFAMQCKVLVNHDFFLYDRQLSDMEPHK